jgi:nucleoside-diphosphate-sugar epimerase
MATILLAGFGKLAHSLAHKLLHNGHHVIGISRSKKNLNHLNFTSITCDLTQPIPNNLINNPIDIAVITLSPDGYSNQDYRRSYFEATRNLLDFFNGTSTTMIWVSSTRVYAQNNGEWVDEQSETRPADDKGKILLDSEHMVLEHHPNNCIVRFAGIYGPDRNRFLNTIKHGAQLQKTPPYYTNRIHQDDCVGLLHFLIEKQIQGKAIDSIYLGCDDDNAPIFEVAEWIAKTFNFPPPQALHLTEYKQNKRCRNERIKQLGYRFHYPNYQAGYRHLFGENSLNEPDLIDD